MNSNCFYYELLSYFPFPTVMLVLVCRRTQDCIISHVDIKVLSVFKILPFSLSKHS